MRLDSTKFELLLEALVDAFSREELQSMVRFSLDVDLDDIAARTTKRDQVSALITWAERQDRIEDLINGARSVNPNNQHLTDAAKAILDDDKVDEQIRLAYTSESPAALRLAVERPEFWEHLLTAELLQVKIAPISQAYSDLKRGLIYQKSRSLADKDDLRIWIQGKLTDYNTLHELLVVAINEDLAASWGEPGQPGDTLEILRAVNRCSDAAIELLEWEKDLHFTRFPYGFESIKTKMKGWTEPSFQKIAALHEEIVKPMKGPIPENGLHRIAPIFDAPYNIADVVEEFKRLYELY